ncbi:uncharacterized protein ACR2FA_000539 [Aphomia sociella]
MHAKTNSQNWISLKMKTRTIILLALGLVGAISVGADPISKQNLSAHNKQPLSESNHTETKLNDGSLLYKAETEQKNDAVPTITATNIKDENGYSDSNVQIIIESIDGPTEELTQSQPMYMNNDIALNEDLYSDKLVDNGPDEIMETAAGFVPIPIFRKRQKARRRFATRRHFIRNPYAYTYRGLHYYYPYYGFYRPSSLKYY